MFGGGLRRTFRAHIPVRLRTGSSTSCGHVDRPFAPPMHWRSSLTFESECLEHVARLVHRATKMADLAPVRAIWPCFDDSVQPRSDCHATQGDRIRGRAVETSSHPSHHRAAERHAQANSMISMQGLSKVDLMKNNYLIPELPELLTLLDPCLYTCDPPNIQSSFHHKRIQSSFRAAVNHRCEAVIYRSSMCQYQASIPVGLGEAIARGRS